MAPTLQSPTRRQLRLIKKKRGFSKRVKLTRKNRVQRIWIQKISLKIPNQQNV